MMVGVCCGMVVMTGILIQTFIHLLIAQIEYGTSVILSASLITTCIEIRTHSVVL